MTVRRRQDEMLWRHSNQPLRAPLLKKLQNKDPQSEQALQCFLDILYCLAHGVCISNVNVNVNVIVVFNANVLRLGEDRRPRRSGTSIWT